MYTMILQGVCVERVVKVVKDIEENSQQCRVVCVFLQGQNNQLVCGVCACEGSQEDRTEWKERREETRRKEKRGEETRGEDRGGERRREEKRRMKEGDAEVSKNLLGRRWSEDVKWPEEGDEY